ncbi:biosynthetic-type acetolactate synthase large subunit [Buchnera aphidicola]|uniref:biosynthetic-type acetolactate synthase large subunit n=1 Tax=Buchnera aphidicola TaxID=9 RepID=UPI0020929A8A|nr:biosynthetic-type acetolactate synthase large subunit [Buchnera aphidicola]USS94279.1 biosynthetic-type acetolactate synthase large subunit [Buchnera aphidicola (Sipha maydis)]
MKIFSGAEIVVKSLIHQGIKHIFGYPGGAILEIYDALNLMKKKIQHILVRHEQAATHMADGYSRSTGKTGVVLVTSGPGATNSITGIATAYMDSIPMVILSGQVESKLIGYDAFQECDMLGISQPIVKHSFLVQKIKDIPNIIQKSFLIASSGRPGPVVIDLPKDILSAENKKPYIRSTNVSVKSLHKNKKINIKKIKKIIKKIIQAKKPIIYIGGGIIHSNSSKELKIFAEKLKIPVTSSLMGLGGFPGTHKQNLGMIGMHGKYTANMGMHYSDLIFALGVRFDDRTTNNTKKYCPSSTIIQIDIDPTSISKTIKTHIKIIGDLKTILKKIIKFLNKIKKKFSEERLKKWWNKINEWKKVNFFKENNQSDIIKPQQVIKILSKLTYGKFYITSDVGQHQMFTALHYIFEKPRQWINSGGLGTMGFGFPAALGVKIALPKKNVMCITGDGSIQMNIQELSTAMQYKIPIMIVNLNNSSLGMVKQWQDLIYFGRHSHSYMKSLPNFIKLVESYGHIGVSISHPKELKKKLKQSLKYLSQKKLVFVDVKVDPTAHVYPMQIKGGGMNEMRFKK